MRKSRFARFASLLAVIAVAASLIGVAVASTGAYFTSTQPGAITGNLGTVAVNISGQSINFANLMPGTPQTQTVTVQNTGTGNEDLYLAFTNEGFVWSAVNTYGRYAKFVIAGKTYDNLNNNSTNGLPPTPGVPGTGPATGPCGTPAVPINYLPHVVSLATLVPGQVWTFDITFEWSACLSSGQGATMFGESDTGTAVTAGPLTFVVAAFQPGVDPLSTFNGTGKITPLTLTTRGTYTNQ
jgi:hypothetical protein